MIEFAPTFQEVLFRVIAACVAGTTQTKTYRRDQVLAWCRRRLARRAA